ncbi:MAG TPA: sugar transferase [Bacilli bacterium]
MRISKMRNNDEVLSSNYYTVKNERENYYYVVKRTVDICGSLLGLILFFPLFLVIGVFIKISDSKGTIFFTQNRIGQQGKAFNIYKFRSMVSNAEQRLLTDPKLYKKYLENNYKLEPHEDPRITRVGKFLRKTSLDEIPQLINVLKGEMSLVGPRPVVREELNEYMDRVVDFLSVKPGVTGYWQISGRSNVRYPERVDLELHYVYNQTFWFDMKILFKTILIVVLKRGAY